MGIKDNFSQAVKELWKKDGQNGETPQGNGANQPSELDQYLRQENADTAAPAPKAPPVGELNSSGVPLETPYYPNSGSAQTNTPSRPQDDFVQNVQNIQSAQGAQNMQSAQEQPEQSARVPQGAQSADDYRNEPPAPPENMNRNAYNAMNQGAQQGYSQGGYGQGGAYTPPSGGGQGRFVPPPSGGAGMPAPMGSEAEETTIISKNTHIEGNIRSLANMTVDGNIKGNLETTRNVDMTGKIVGDIIANNTTMSSAAMQGNISLKGRMKMDRDTILIGDLSSQYADINGRIRGKLDIVGKAELKRDAIVFGDINASTIAVTDGAIIQGYVNTTFLSKDDSRNVFPDAISIEEQKQSAKAAAPAPGASPNPTA